MKTIYLVSNNLMSKVKFNFLKDVDLNEARTFTMLSKKGEENAHLLSKNPNLENIDIIYTSKYFNALETAKIIAEEKEMDLYIADDLSERLVGELGSNEYRFLKGMQEHDFTYKLTNGESIKEVNERMKVFLTKILNSQEEQILVVSHNIAIMSLLVSFCNKGFSLEDHLILNYQDNVLFDGVFHEMDLIKMTMDNKKIINIERIL